MIYLIRHGQTDWNVQGKAQGFTDIPLNGKGRQQAVEAARKVAKLQIDHIFSSDLSRAKETAEIINSELRLDLPITTDKRIRAYNLGELEGGGFMSNGITATEFLTLTKQHGVETTDEMFSRVKSFLDDLVAKKIENVLIVSHIGTIRMMLYCAKHQTLDEDLYMKEYFTKLIENAKPMQWK